MALVNDLNQMEQTGYTHSDLTVLKDGFDATSACITKTPCTLYILHIKFKQLFTILLLLFLLFTIFSALMLSVSQTVENKKKKKKKRKAEEDGVQILDLWFTGQVA